MSIGGNYSFVLAVLVIFAFMIMFAKRWLSEEGVAFNWIFAAAGTVVAYIITISLSCSYKLGLIIGLAAMIIFGFGTGYFMDGGEY